MKGYAYDEVFRPWMREAHALATYFVDRIQDRPDGLRCHEVARAVARFLNRRTPPYWPAEKLVPFDGRYGGVEHTWIPLTQRFILDPYAVGRHPLVQLVDSSVVGPKLYETGPVRVDIQEDIIEELLRG